MVAACGADHDTDVAVSALAGGPLDDWNVSALVAA
jgi:hypothetical protein